MISAPGVGDLDMTRGSPTMLKHYVVLAHQDNVNKELATLFAVKGLLAADQTLDWDLLRSFLGKKKIPSIDKAACIAALYGSFPTPAWLWAHGWEACNTCFACEQTNDLAHVTNGCGPPNIDYVKDIAKALAPLRKPEVFDIVELMLCTINGCPVPMENFAFDPDLPIYTDGSAMHVGIMALAVSAGAAFQIGKDGLHYVVRCQVPRAFPQSAVAAEHMAIHLVFRFLYLRAGHRGATIISDCQAVVSAFAHPHLYQGYRAKFGGLWREPGLLAVYEVLKTPAHRTREEAIAQNDEANWFGNDKADYWAKFALAGTDKDGSDYT